MTYAEELRVKRRSSLIVVFTLGLAALFLDSVRPMWMTNIFEGTSMGQHETMGPILKIVSFLFFGLLTAAILFIIHLFKVIYYTIEIHRNS